jgi:predicted DNA-binding transcriptional regulator AlpA
MDKDVIQSVGKILQDYVIITDKTKGEIAISIAFERLTLEAEKLSALVKDERQKWQREQRKKKLEEEKTPATFSNGASKNAMLNTAESAEYLRVSRRTFDNLKYQPGFPRPIKLSAGKIFYKASDLDRWIAKQ